MWRPTGSDGGRLITELTERRDLSVEAINKTKSGRKSYAAAVYLRLSKEDGDAGPGSGKGESNSITNQKRLIYDFLKGKEDIRVFQEYVDDGYTGSDFCRPSFQKMIKDIEAGKVNLIIVKDLSRFGREYIEAGRYLQKIFPAAGVRFIAVTDRYDSLTAGQTEKNIVIPVKNFVNDAYSADLSVKIRSHLESKRRNGEYTGAYVSYGFIKDGANHGRLMPDPVAGENIKRIFRWKLEGMSNRLIADKLNTLGIPAPADYKRSLGIRYKSGFQKNLYSRWSPAAVGRILSNPLCKGLVVQGKQERVNHKIKKMRARPETEQSRFRQEDLAIIGEKEFDAMQELLKKDARTVPGRERAYLFSGLLFCPDCGRQMIRRKTVYQGKETGFYICKTYNVEKSCTRHSIRENELAALVTEAVRAQIRLAAEWEEVLLAVKDAEKKQAERGRAGFLSDSRVRELAAELEENKFMLSGLCADRAEGLLSEEEYREMRAFYENRGRELQRQMEERKAYAEKAAEAAGEAGRWLAGLKNMGKWASREEKATAIRRSLICLLIERIWVYEGKHVEISFLYEDGTAGRQALLSAIKEAAPEQTFFQKGAL